MRIVWALGFLLTMCTSRVLFGQTPILVENFDYPIGDTLGSYWNIHSGATNPIEIVSPALSYTGYPSSGLGASVYLEGSGEDYNRTFEPVTSGDVYASMLVNASGAKSGDYFFHFSTQSVSSSYYRGKLYIKLNGDQLQFGVEKGTGGATYVPGLSDLSTTHLVVVRYRFVSGADNDSVSLWVDPSVPGPEGPPDVSVADLSSDAPSIGSVILRQGGSSTAPTLTIGGLRVAAVWNDIPLPVTMEGVSARVEGGSVILNFSTASEVDVAGFNVLRSSSQTGPFEMRSTYVSNDALRASGVGVSGASYSFVDSRVSAGQTYYYQIQVVEKSGRIECLSGVVEVSLKVPKEFALYQNYPNPFNPSTTIRYVLKEPSDVRIQVFDLLGRTVRSMSLHREAGTFETAIDMANMPSGVYYCRMTAAGKLGGDFVGTKKMVLMR